MIIEFVDLGYIAEPGDADKLILVHMDIGKDQANHVKDVCEALVKLFPSFKVMRIPRGQPCPNNPLPKISVINAENKQLLEAMKVICERERRPGEVVLLSEEQMKALATAEADGDLKTF